MLCPVCQGSGSIVTFKRGLEYWNCPCCYGAGVTYLHSSPFVQSRTRKKEKANATHRIEGDSPSMS